MTKRCRLKWNRRAVSRLHWWSKANCGRFRAAIFSGSTERPCLFECRRSGGTHGGQLPMPRRQTILISPLVAFLAMGYAPGSRPGSRAARRPQQGRPQQTRCTRPAQNAQEFPPEAMDELLRQWEGQSAKLETLEVDIYRIDRTSPGAMRPISPAMPPSRARSGLCRLSQGQAEGPARPQGQGQEDVRSSDDKNGQLDSKPFETILCTGTEVWHYRSDVRQVIIWSSTSDARRRPSTRGRCPSSSG